MRVLAGGVSEDERTSAVAGTEVAGWVFAQLSMGLTLRYQPMPQVWLRMG